MQIRLKDLDHVINLNPPDMKKLQLKLQGSVSVQVFEDIASKQAFSFRLCILLN